MSRYYEFARNINLYVPDRVSRMDAARQEATAHEILRRFIECPGVVLADEVGMGKTFVAMAVATSIVLRNADAGPIVVMVPPSLQEKWPRDWSVFRDKCLLPTDRERLRATHTAVESGVAFLQLLDDSPATRHNVIFLTHGVLSRGLTDPWVKLALIRRAFRRPSLRNVRRAFPSFASRLLRMETHRRVTPELLEQILSTRPAQWGKILIHAGVSVNDNPVPEALVEEIDKLDKEHIDSLAQSLKSLPLRESARINERMQTTRDQVTQAIRSLWHTWLAHSCRRTTLPLLILDEAHHLKNLQTRLASLFPPEAEEEGKLLGGPLNSVFERMLFLTATPFQLGHHELLRVLGQFENIAWRSTTSAPNVSRETISGKLVALRTALDHAQAAVLALDKVWGRLRPEDLQAREGNPCSVEEWWGATQNSDTGSDTLASEICCRYAQADDALRKAEGLLRPWVIRHLKPRTLSDNTTLRRMVLPGAAIRDPSSDGGLEVDGNALLPFLLAARAAAISAREAKRALFAEGLASSYEAYRDTRRGNGVRDEADNSMSSDAEGADMAWYLHNLDRALPPNNERVRAAHPKVAETVAQAVKLWRLGEKVLIFCHYRATGRALLRHVSRALNDAIMQLGKQRFKLDSVDAARQRLEQLSERFRSRDDRLRREADHELSALAGGHGDFTIDDREKVVDVMRRFLRTPSFLARFFPPETRRRDGAVAEALEQADASGLTLRQRLEEFCHFLAERCTDDERAAYLAALDQIQTGKHMAEGERLLANVRLANGETEDATRRRLLLTFNTPFFPEILVTSSVLGEGVDLHLDCRFVIHHDLCWNPSTLEHRTGRIDRLGARGERSQQPIHVYFPYIAATQDEKMFRVVRDRARWFQVIMGEKYEVDEAATERHAERVPLPEAAARALAFRLEVTSNV